MQRNTDSNTVYISKADQALRNKAGTGEIPVEKIRLSQKQIDQNNVDFQPIAEIYLERLSQALQNARQNMDAPADTLLGALEKPVMNLKSNGALFGYPLISDIATNMLRFIETRSKVDEDLLDIIQLYLDSQNIIINQKIKGTGGSVGLQIQDELQNACRRYISKLKA